jgi:hypothetical protein
MIRDLMRGDLMMRIFRSKRSIDEKKKKKPLTDLPP